MTQDKLVLLVEDNELNRDMMVRRLKRAGLKVITAGNGQYWTAGPPVAAPRKMSRSVISRSSHLPPTQQKATGSMHWPPDVMATPPNPWTSPACW